jgi:glutamyl-tRNA synthetase
MNAQYIARLPAAELADTVRARLVEAGLDRSPIVEDERSFHRLLELLRPRAKRLSDFAEQAAPLLSPTVEYQPDAVEKHLSTQGLREHVAALADALHSVSPFDESHVEAAVRGTAAGRGIRAGQLIHAVRVALTGRTTSPGLFELIVLLGREETGRRLARLLAFLSAPVS